jgi:release factor glutamine methyltransferase
MKKSGIESAAFDFDYILSECFGISKAIQLSEPQLCLEKQEQSRLSEIINRYIAGEPLQYLLGFTWFMDSKFTVGPQVLIPRSDTEILCESAIQAIREKNRPVQILDLCSGSGCIGISILKACPDSRLVMADISEYAVSLSRKNARDLIPGLDYQVIQSDLFDALPDENFDFIVSNPPYIASPIVDGLEDRVKKYEPRLALDGGPDGLTVYRRMISEAPSHLSSGGMLILEIGYDQAAAVKNLLENAHFTNIRLLKDYGGNYRVAAACLSSSSKTV